MNDELSERELWLMRKAWIDGWCAGDSNSMIKNMTDWLNDIVADGGITVKMALEKEAPR